MRTPLRALGRITLALGLGLGLVAPASAAWAKSEPAPTGLHSAAPRLDTAGLQTALDDLTAGYGVGAVAQVVGQGERWSSASGVRRLSGRQPAARPTDRVRVASVTKSMVATLALQEVERGRWKLTTRVDDVLPGLLPGHGDVTLEQLLSHRSGLPDYLVALLSGATSEAAFLDVLSTPYTDRQLVRAALTLPWSFPSGSDFGYSNTNFVVVGLMLARQNHRSVRTLLERRVFTPARMHDSAFPRSPRIRGAHLTEYMILGQPYSLAGFEPSIFSSAGAVVSTARDVNRFYAALLSGRLLRPALVRTMLTARTDEPLAYGLGVFAVPDPCPATDGQERLLYGHDGASFGTLTLALSSPDGRRQVTVAVTGRNWDPEATPLPIGQFAYAALTATCPDAPGAQTQQRAERSSQQVPWLDLSATDSLRSR